MVNSEDSAPGDSALTNSPSALSRLARVLASGLRLDGLAAVAPGRFRTLPFWLLEPTAASWRLVGLGDCF